MIFALNKNIPSRKPKGHDESAQPKRGERQGNRQELVNIRGKPSDCGGGKGGTIPSPSVNVYKKHSFPSLNTKPGKKQKHASAEEGGARGALPNEMETPNKENGSRDDDLGEGLQKISEASPSLQKKKISTWGLVE